MNTQITERIHRITGLVETKNPGSAAEMIQEDKEIGSVFLEVLKPEIDKKIDHERKNDLFEYVRDGEFAATKAGMSVEDFRSEMEQRGYKEPQTA